MRNEKKLLAQELVGYIKKSNYFFLADYKKVSVAEISMLRKALKVAGGELHVIKNSLFKVALNDCSLPKMDDVLSGQIAIVVGGEEPSEVAKVLKKFHDDSKQEKLAIKSGLLENVVLTMKDVFALADLPSKDVLRATLLCVFNAPAQKLVRLLNTVPQSMLNVLQAKADK